MPLNTQSEGTVLENTERMGINFHQTSPTPLRNIVKVHTRNHRSFFFQFLPLLPSTASAICKIFHILLRKFSPAWVRMPIYFGSLPFGDAGHSGCFDILFLECHVTTLNIKIWLGRTFYTTFQPSFKNKKGRMLAVYKIFFWCGVSVLFWFSHMDWLCTFTHCISISMLMPWCLSSRKNTIRQGRVLTKFCSVFKTGEILAFNPISSILPMFVFV